MMKSNLEKYINATTGEYIIKNNDTGTEIKGTININSNRFNNDVERNNMLKAFIDNYK